MTKKRGATMRFPGKWTPSSLICIYVALSRYFGKTMESSIDVNRFSIGFSNFQLFFQNGKLSCSYESFLANRGTLHGTKNHNRDPPSSFFFHKFCKWRSGAFTKNTSCKKKKKKIEKYPTTSLLRIVISNCFKQDFLGNHYMFIFDCRQHFN